MSGEDTREALDAATLRAVRSQVHDMAPWPNPQWLMVFRVWLDEQLAIAEAASRLAAPVGEMGWLHAPDCPYGPYADRMEDAPEDVACTCGEGAIAARWKARCLLLRAQVQTLTERLEKENAMLHEEIDARIEAQCHVEAINRSEAVMWQQAKAALIAAVERFFADRWINASTLQALTAVLQAVTPTQE